MSNDSDNDSADDTSLFRSAMKDVRRLDNDSTFTGQTLVSGTDYSLNGLTEVNFRGGDAGKFLLDRRWSGLFVTVAVAHIDPAACPSRSDGGPDGLPGSGQGRNRFKLLILTLDGVDGHRTSA